MTWAVGIKTPFPYTTLVSDIAVTVNNNSYYDCLQKVYPITRFLAASFAGSVEIGFYLIQDLIDQSRINDPTKAVWPRVFIHKWYRRASYIFATFPKAKQALGSELLIAGLDPQFDSKKRPFENTHIVRLRAPSYLPEYAKVNRPISIGSGNAVSEYQKAVRSIDSLLPTLYNWEVDEMHGIGNALAQFAGRTAVKTKVAGISHHMHVCKIYRWNISIASNHSFIEDKVQQKMPEVAKSWNELKDLLKKQGVSAEGATCRLQ